MEEKKYHIEESKIVGDKVCEPSPVYASVASESVSHHMIDSGIEQKDEIPVLKNHFSYEGLLEESAAPLPAGSASHWGALQPIPKHGN